jgi:hypothetical protein
MQCKISVWRCVWGGARQAAPVWGRAQARGRARAQAPACALLLQPGSRKARCAGAADGGSWLLWRQVGEVCVWGWRLHRTRLGWCQRVVWWGLARNECRLGNVRSPRRGCDDQSATSQEAAKPESCQPCHGRCWAMRGWEGGTLDRTCRASNTSLRAPAKPSTPAKGPQSPGQPGHKMPHRRSQGGRGRGGQRTPPCPVVHRPMCAAICAS